MAMNSPPPLLDVRGLCVGRGAQRILDTVDMSIASGEIVALLGANGAGKTTLARCVAGLMQPRAGSVWLDGARVDSTHPASRGALGMAVDHWLLPLELSGNECVQLFARAQGQSDYALSAAPLLLSLGLDAGLLAQPLGLYSVGTRQKLGLALGMLGSPRLLVLDESLSGLDAVSLAAAEALLRARCAQGAAVLLVTHALEHAARFADRLLLLHAGRVAGAWRRDELTVLAGQGHDLLQVLGTATAIQAASGGAG
ncbi:ATP-binding cassette domain-containing protein [Metallibacterium scheffleri]|nr:ATP-binding cassette domain-containing protein [Metallibacterium scheffleri]